jgi:hypothetical protein
MNRGISKSVKRAMNWQKEKERQKFAKQEIKKFERSNNQLKMLNAIMFVRRLCPL